MAPRLKAVRLRLVLLSPVSRKQYTIVAGSPQIFVRRKQSIRRIGRSFIGEAVPNRDATLAVARFQMAPCPAEASRFNPVALYRLPMETGSAMSRTESLCSEGLIPDALDCCRAACKKSTRDPMLLQALHQFHLV